MNPNRRQFSLGIASAALGLSALPQLARAAEDQPAKPARPPYFFKHPIFEMIFLTSLGRAYHSAGDVGKVLYLSTQVEDGNFESAFQAFKKAGDEAREIAEDSLAHGHKQSALHAYLWAQNYYDSATYFIDGSKDPTRFLPTWELLDDCWMKSLPLFDPPVETISMFYDRGILRGFYFRGKSAAEKRPLLIAVNGSDGSLLDMWLWGGVAAQARGYDYLIFDGPGQGYTLWKQNLHFRPDFENVITPVVDYLVTRSDIDLKKIAIQGISQGGYWVPRAVAFEKRIAAAIVDPGVVDVSTSWLATLPKPMLELLNADKKEEFDAAMSKNLNDQTKAILDFRMRPYGFKSYYDTYKAVLKYNLTDVAPFIQCPMLITSPANEAYWPGQSRKLFDLLKCPKKLIEFTESEGADLHCEPKATGLRDLRIFNWLDETLEIK